MPPAISSEDEQSDVEVEMPAAKNSGAKKSAKGKVAVDDEDDFDQPEEAVNGQAEDEDDEDDENGDGEEDEYVVEKIVKHIISEETGEPLFQVKWEGWDAEGDLTWEPEENLKDSAKEILDEYFASIGGRENLFEQFNEAVKTKKRGRPSTGTPSSTNKRAKRNGEPHPLDSGPPLTKTQAPWRPPAGSWEEDIAQLDACEDEATHKLMVYLTWKNGQKTQHETAVIYRHCPQKMLQFYERHVRVIKRDVEE